MIFADYVYYSNFNDGVISILSLSVYTVMVQILTKILMVQNTAKSLVRVLSIKIQDSS